ncbi:hypothetical protein Q8A67_001232 [Cirrhinus molitorella]|uniref:Mono(ADP-ribosyl)transferase n=1 Tax=Cirrhinus molitorella TaxID=172907 RepID=A0AA88Q6S0_9TELE|nr:hypothetical protein Q8A67_001232 [Cirrhinus molitorella]
MLLIIEALLLISAALGQDHRAAGVKEVFPLDMAPNSVDDNYDGCTKEMANLLPHEKEVLIPPYEKFKVTAVKTRKGQKDLWCETVYELKSSGNRSDLNCALFKKPTKNIMK